MKKNFDIILQSRYLSSRLPGKILLGFNKTNFLSYLIKNLKKIKNIRNIIISSPDDKFKDIFGILAKKNNISFYAPRNVDEKNVLKRFVQTANFYKSKNIIRVTSDCPFVNIPMINSMIEYYKSNTLEFVANNNPRYVPHGFDCEIFTYKILKQSFNNCKNKNNLEHVTPWIRMKHNKPENYIKFYENNYSQYRLTLDTLNDYLFFLKNQKLLTKIPFSKDPIKILKKIK